MTDTPLIATTLCRSLDATIEFSVLLARQLRTGDVVALRGDLGVGKTVVARAMIRELCGSDTEVPSPTFNLLLTYDGLDPDIILYHYDLYRLEQPEDVLELDIEDAFDQGISLIEWSDRMGRFLPETHLSVLIEQGEKTEERRISIFGNEGWRHRLAGFREGHHA